MAEPNGRHRTSASTGRVLMLFGASILFTLGDGSVQLLLAPHLQEQGIAPPVIGPIVAAYSIAALLSRFLTGAIYRAERIRFLVPAGCAIQSVSFLVLANSSSPTMLTIATAANGMGFAVASTGGLAAVMELRPGGNAGSLMGWYTGCIGVGYSLSSFAGGIAGDLLGIPTAIMALAVLPLIAGSGLATATWRLEATVAAEGAPPTPRGLDLRAFTQASVYVWLAFFCALHINLLSGVLMTFFPLYALAIGLSLTQIGVLFGLHSAVSSSIRFSTPLLFRNRSYRPFLPWMVILGGLAAAGLTVSSSFHALAIAWCVIGASRAILRVSSAALAMDAAAGTDQRRGAASGIYLSGLDLGKIVGPFLGGFSVDRFGFEPTFLMAGLGVPAVFFIFYTRLKLREARESSSAPGTADRPDPRPPTDVPLDEDTPD